MKPRVSLLNPKMQPSFSKKILTAVFAVIFISASAFAAAGNENEKAIASLKKEFNTAKDIQWKVTDNFIKASFSWNNQQMEVFYNYDGETIAKSRHIKTESLPMKAQETLSKKYAGCAVDEAIEFNGSEGEHYYYASLVKDNKKIILQITDRGDVSIFKK